MIDKPSSEQSTDYPGYILVTGAGGGIGLALVGYLLSKGIRRIVCQYRSQYQELAGLLAAHGLSPSEHCVCAELTDEAQVKNLRMQANERFGGIWGLINLAGRSSNAVSWKLSKEEFLQVISDNLLTTFLCTREFTPDFRARESGRIINVTSVVAFSGVFGAAHYAAAKAGIVGFTKAVALELANKNVTVNVLALGYFEYGLINQVPVALQDEIRARTPLKRFGKGREIGGIIEYLLSEDGGFTTGQVLHLNGGLYL
ncbi:MAG: SDR family NAD(P)-dependent oxidoreductase [candidate division WOR-3 bacterium]|nr:SDR family NAD(P)-dependent oxidoreductase [candidate division WOR-3 bacterium]